MRKKTKGWMLLVDGICIDFYESKGWASRAAKKFDGKKIEIKELFGLVK
jgi:hypothetical protein